MSYVIPELQENPEIADRIFKPTIDFNNKDEVNLLVEQYKLLVDSAHKMEERRKDSNSVFITLNSVFMSTLGYSDRLTHVNIKNIFFFIMFVMVGFTLTLSWLKIIHSYRRINDVNYMLIRAFEKHLPSTVFSTRAELTADYASEEATETTKSNLILEKETAIPLVFLFVYSAYTVVGLVLLLLSR